MNNPIPRILLSLTLCVATTLSASNANAACFREAVGVPGALHQAPQWWVAAPAVIGSSTNRWIDDPRWQGASAFGEFEDGVSFRGLIDTEGSTRYLVLMWHIRNDASGSTGDDRIFVGLHDDTMSRGLALRIDASSIVPTEGAAPGAVELYFNEGSTTTGWVAQPTPTWLADETKIDVFAGNEWAVRVRIPITTSNTVLDQAPLTPGGTYRFFHQVQSDTSATSSEYSLPDSLAFVNHGSDCLTSDLCAAAISSWEAFSDTTPCVGDISIQPSHIYVGSLGNTEVSLSSPNAIHAHPVNNTTNDLNQDSIRAKFRLANWGSTIGDSPTWQPLACTEGVDSEGYLTPPAGTVTPSTGGNPDFDIICTWSVPGADVPLYDPSCIGPTCRHRDQCVLVELSMATTATLGAPVHSFAPQSAWRNLMFTGASKITKSALIDVQGLEKDDPARDVYLYVKTSNMPRTVTEDTPGPARKINDILAKKLARAKISLPDGRAVGAKDAAMIQRAMAQGLITDEELELFMPTYTVYAWHDTGKKHNGKPIVEPMPSFAYVVHHDGPLEGWRYNLTAPGHTISEILPNYYKLTVPKGGQATVVSMIHALEQPACDCELTDIPDHEHPKEHPHGEVPPHKHSCGCDIPGKERGGSGLLFLGLLLFVGAGIRRKWGIAA